MIHLVPTHADSSRSGRRTLAACLVLLVGAWACGGGSDEPAAPDPAATPPAVESTPDPAAGDDPPGLTRMQETEVVRPRAVAPVAFERLVALLPAAEGWETDGPRGAQHTMPVPYATAEVVYRREDSSVRLEIIDSGYQPLLLAPHEMFLTPGYEERSSDGFTRAGAVGGSPGYRRWHASRQRGEIVAIAGGRYIVSATGTGVADLDPIEAIVSRVNIRAVGDLR